MNIFELAKRTLFPLALVIEFRDTDEQVEKDILNDNFDIPTEATKYLEVHELSFPISSEEDLIKQVLIKRLKTSN